MRRSHRPWALLAASVAFGLGVAVGAWTGQGEAPRRPATPAGHPAIVELGSTSCASCRAMQPVLAELDQAHGSALDVHSIDVLRRRAAIAEWDVKAIPTQVFLDGTGREIERHVGFMSADGVRSVFARHGIPLPRVSRHEATGSPRPAP